MKEVVQKIEKGSKARSNLISGETGVGKELVARALHEKSTYGHNDFIVVNCADLNKELIGSEFFGHEAGAFTGAHAQHIGFCEQADGGTLFLDEIGELPLDVQPPFFAGPCRPVIPPYWRKGTNLAALQIDRRHQS
jgi:transcriptional regulator with GAF, ATPase, and Fis domain